MYQFKQAILNNEYFDILDTSDCITTSLTDEGPMELVSEYYSDDGRIEAHVCKGDTGFAIYFYEDDEMVAIRNYPENSLPYVETVAENHVMGLKQY